MHLIASNRNCLTNPLNTKKISRINDKFFMWINTMTAQSNFYDSEMGWCYVHKKPRRQKIEGNSNVARRFFLKYLQRNKYFLANTSIDRLIIIFDRRIQKLFIYRDFVGLQHVYYTNIDNYLIISTSINPIINLVPKNKLKISKSSLELYLTFQYIPSPNTIFENVFQIPATSILEYSLFNLSIHKKSTIFQDTKIVSNNDQAKPTKRLKEILTKALSNQLEGNPKNVGALLSGGIDTSSNISLLVEEIGIKPIVFTACFKNKKYDELPYAKIISEKYKLDHHKILIEHNIINYLTDFVQLFDNPIADRAALPQYLISLEASKLNISSMVSGEGGDELLGYPRNLSKSLSLENQYTNSLLAKYYLNFSALSDKKLINKLLGVENGTTRGQELLSKLYKEMNNRSNFEKIYYGQWKTWLIENVYLKDLKIFEYFSFNYITPFIDLDLMKHMIKQKTHKKPSLVKNKTYLKKSLKGLLMEKTLQKTKHKFHVPMNGWFKNEWFELLHDTLLSSNSYVYKNFDKTVLKQMIYDHKNSTHDYNRPLWALLVLEFWISSKIN